jgi:hypothetical protein
MCWSTWAPLVDSHAPEDILAAAVVSISKSATFSACFCVFVSSRHEKAPLKKGGRELNNFLPHPFDGCYAVPKIA